MCRIKNISSASVWLVVTLALAVSACQKSTDLSEAQHLDRAKTYRAQGKTQSEIIELKNILQSNPKHAEAHWVLGETYANLGYGKEAEQELRRAQELGIDSETIKVPLGKALLEQKEYKRVLNEIQPGSASGAKNIAAIKTLYAQAELGLKQFEKGCELFREAKQADPSHVPAYWGVAQCSLGFGKPIEAAEELDKALQLDPKNVETWLLRGDLWRNQKQLAEAEKAYGTGLGLRPEHLALLLARASVRVTLNNHVGALEDINYADRRSKDHPLALHLRGVMLYKDKKYTEAKTAFESVLLTNSDYLPAILWLGMTDYALNNLEQASHAFARYVVAVPNSTEVQAFLAIAKARLGGKKAATESLAALDKVDINDPQTLVLIGQAHLLTGDEQASARYLTRAIEKKPDAIDPRVNLVAALLQKGDKPGAVRQAEALLKKSPNELRSAAVMIAALLADQQSERALEIVRHLEQQMPGSAIPPIYRAAIRVEMNDLDGAKVDLEKAYKIQPENVLVGHSLAAIAITRNQLSEARRYYQQVRDKNAEPFETLMAMYDLEVLAKQPSAARKLVETVAAKYPKAARPAAIIATAYVRAGQPDKALELSAQAATDNPNDLHLLTARGTAYFEKGDMTNAVVQFNRIVKLRPDLVEAHIKLAFVYSAKGDYSALRNALQQALRLDSKHSRARLMLSSLNIREKKFDDALKLANSVEQDDPSLLEAYILQSTALSLLKRDVDALKTLERARIAAPSSDLPVVEMAKLRFNARQADMGFKIVKTWLQSHPNNVRAIAFLAESLMIYNKEDEAIAAYEQILKLEPENPIALNNIANLLTTREPKRALTFAEIAYKRITTDVAVTDTYGWLLVKAGDPKRGLDLIKKAFEAAPNVPEIHFHLAAAMAQNGDKAQAKRELEKLLNNQRNSPIKKEAEALLATL